LLLLDGGPRYLAFLWANPRVLSVLTLNLLVASYWLARRVSQALLLRSTGAKLRAAHEPPWVVRVSWGRVRRRDRPPRGRVPRELSWLAGPSHRRAPGRPICQRTLGRAASFCRCRARLCPREFRRGARFRPTAAPAPEVATKISVQSKPHSARHR